MLCLEGDMHVVSRFWMANKGTVQGGGSRRWLAEGDAYHISITFTNDNGKE